MYLTDNCNCNPIAAIRSDPVATVQTNNIRSMLRVATVTTLECAGGLSDSGWRQRLVNLQFTSYGKGRQCKLL